ncbi:hypothetical protein [Sphingomonas lutea]|uniref:hypothetical protein n=1 Tax=Sphingomonas lutea TaxID=1045317 RepID=UPI001CB719BD|nr:hypothetical protein [Sphingomonas lutea]
MKLHRDCGFGEVSIAPLQPVNGGNAPIPPSGTPHAISYLTLGGAALSACSIGRGGARNRAERVSYALSAAQIANLSAAGGYSVAIGLPFTRMLTIHWEAAGVPLSGMAKATGRFTDLLTKCLTRHGSKTAWLWVHENGDGKGGHCHLLAHVPAHLVQTVASLQRGWLRRITGQPYRARVIYSKPIGGRLGLEEGNPELHAINLDAALGYLLKGASDKAAAQFRLERLEAGGRIIGKRCGTSQNIGAKARTEQQR